MPFDHPRVSGLRCACRSEDAERREARGKTAREGDGVRARVISSDQGEVGSWVAHHEAVETNVYDVNVREGTTLDFVVDCRTNDGYDSFEWAPLVRLPDGADEWDAARDFHGPSHPLSPWERYAQVLLETNELIFED